MSNTQHTPGPWSITESSEHWGRINCTITSQDGDVATSWQQGTTLNRVNARLIAAAPELLSALNAMLTHMGMDEDEWNKPTFDQARAAIAKATGGAA